MQGCEIFITTPRCLSRLIKEKSPVLFDKDRVRHLVIEKLDSCFDRFRNEFIDILNAFNVFNESADVPTQTIVTARAWHPALKLFFKCPSNPLLCIGAYIEAAVYGNTKISLSLVSQEKKLWQTLCKCVLRI